MTPEVRAFVARAVAAGPRPRRVVEFGSRDLNGTVRDLFPGAAYTGVDLVPGPAVDVVADAAVWRPQPRAGEAPDVVVCCEVLEHTPAGPAILANAHALLAPGGRLVVTAAAPGRAPHSAADGGPLGAGEYYRNVPPAELRAWLRPFAAVEAFESHPARGDVYAVARKADG